VSEASVEGLEPLLRKMSPFAVTQLLLIPVTELFLHADGASVTVRVWGLVEPLGVTPSSGKVIAGSSTPVILAVNFPVELGIARVITAPEVAWAVALAV